MNKTGESNTHKENSPGIIAWQWVTYAFWGWLVFATALLASNVLSHFLVSNSDDSFAPYGIAAVLVLLPAAIICDILYSKHEPVKKTGGASIIMIVHAVIFTLISIGAFISIAVSIVQLLVSSSDIDTILVSIYTSLIVTALYLLVTIRIINPKIIGWFKNTFLATMAVVVGLTTILGITGPLSSVISTKDDRLIDDNLALVQQAIDSYASSKNKLPEVLTDVKLSGKAKTIANRGLVRYVANSKEPKVINSNDETLSSYTIRYYQLCVSYQQERQPYDGFEALRTDEDADGYSNYLMTDNHPAGEYCYKVSTYPVYVKN